MIFLFFTPLLSKSVRVDNIEFDTEISTSNFLTVNGVNISMIIFTIHINYNIMNLSCDECYGK